MNPFTYDGEIDQAAIAAHEMFESCVRAGFTRQEALQIVIALLTRTRLPEES